MMSGDAEITFFRTVLEKLVESEEKQRQSKEEAEDRAKELAHYAEAFVEDLDEDQLFSAMFESDTYGKALLTTGNIAMDIYSTYPLYAQHTVLVGFCNMFCLGYS
jgi:hypothetical protein